MGRYEDQRERRGPKETDVTAAARRHGEAGFTLIELMVAVVLLLIVLIPLPQMLVSAIRASMISEAQNTGALLAQEQIEELRGLAYPALVLNSALVDSDSGIQGSYPALTFVYGTSDTAWNVVAGPGGTVVPVSADVVRRKVSFTIKRYVLWADEQETFKKLVVKVSWVKPRPAELVIETDAENIAGSDLLPPVVIGSFPYVGDAFHAWTEIGSATAVAKDEDGSVTAVAFQYKKNVDANFSVVGNAGTGTAIGDGYYRYSVAWNTNLASENQYNLRVIATDNDGLSSVETHPFFLDTTPPPPPSSVLLTNPNGTAIDPSVGCTWPPMVSWPAVEDYIDGNTSFNMVIGYLVYRDERDSSVAAVTSSLVASLYGSGTDEFLDATLGFVSPNLTKDVRYRIKSLGRAAYWRASGLSSLSFTAYTTPWVTVGKPVLAGGFPAFTDYGTPYSSGTKVVAEPAGWSAVRLDWKAQHDLHGHIADLYLIYRSPSWDGTGSWTLVQSVWAADASTETGDVRYIDENLTRDTDYQYKVVPVYTPEYLAADPGGSSATALARTSIY